MLAYTGNLLVMKDSEAASQEVAQRFACAAVRAVADHGVFAVAIPGGSSPRRMFELLASPEYSCLVPWNNTQVFFTDERFVPSDHQESNYRLAYELLLSKVPIPEANIHRFATELTPHEAADAYEKEFKNTLGDYASLDMVILGIGSDTHTASLFPGSPALDEMNRFAAENYIEKLGAYRLTLTYPAINSAREVIILAMGADKADAVKIALSAEPDVFLHPVHGIKPSYGKLLWIIDKDSAAKL